MPWRACNTNRFLHSRHHFFSSHRLLQWVLRGTWILVSLHKCSRCFCYSAGFSLRIRNQQVLLLHHSTKCSQFSNPYARYCFCLKPRVLRQSTWKYLSTLIQKWTAGCLYNSEDHRHHSTRWTCKSKEKINIKGEEKNKKGFNIKTTSSHKITLFLV